MGNSDYKKIIIFAIIFILLIIISVFAYTNLTKDYETSSLNSELKFENKIERAKNFTVFTYEEEKVRMLDFKGKPIVVNFWATWCGPCRVELPAFEELYKEYGDRVQFMMVNLTDGKDEVKDTVQNFVNKGKYTFPVFFDLNQAAYNTYNLFQIPRTLFVDKNGNLVYSHLGAMSKSTIESYIK